MKIYAFQSIGLPQIIAEDADHSGLKATLTIPKESIFDIAKVLMVYAFHNIEQQAVQEFAREIISTVIDPVPCHDPRFNEQDLQSMWEGALEEAGDLSTKEIAELVMDSWDLVSCIAACTVIDGNHVCEPLAEMLQHLANEGEDYVNGEFLRLHDDGDGYPALLDFAKRMGLIDEAEENITDLGREYMESLL